MTMAVADSAQVFFSFPLPDSRFGEETENKNILIPLAQLNFLRSITFLPPFFQIRFLLPTHSSQSQCSLLDEPLASASAGPSRPQLSR